jgi:hypothetical protein
MELRRDGQAGETNCLIYQINLSVDSGNDTDQTGSLAQGVSSDRAISDPVESDLGSSYMFLRIFLTRTGIRFAGKRSGRLPDLMGWNP